MTTYLFLPLDRLAHDLLSLLHSILRSLTAFIFAGVRHLAMRTPGWLWVLAKNFAFRNIQFLSFLFLTSRRRGRGGAKLGVWSADVGGTLRGFPIL